jgi:hypothetical protein
VRTARGRLPWSAGVHGRGLGGIVGAQPAEEAKDLHVEVTLAADVEGLDLSREFSVDAHPVLALALRSVHGDIGAA